MAEHRAYQLYAHITWHTWCRTPCIDSRAASDVRTAVSEAARRARIVVLALAVLADHVHVLVSFQPTTVLSDFVRVAKAASSVMANRRVTGSVRWARGFYAASLHKTDLARVVRYVHRQFERHPDLIPAPRRERLSQF